MNGKLTDLVTAFNVAKRVLENAKVTQEVSMAYLNELCDERQELLGRIIAVEDEIRDQSETIGAARRSLEKAEQEIRAFCSQVGTAERLMGGNREAE